MTEHPTIDVERITSAADVAPNDLIVVCEECDAMWTVEPLWAHAHFKEKSRFHHTHERHTGHGPNDPISASNHFEDAEWTEWIVTCNTCDRTWASTTESGARKIYNQHELHAGHPADDITDQPATQETLSTQ